MQIELWPPVDNQLQGVEEGLRKAGTTSAGGHQRGGPSGGLGDLDQGRRGREATFGRSSWRAVSVLCPCHNKSPQTQRF